VTRKTVRIAMNGVTGRMGYRQHLVRSILALREQGGLDLGDGTVLWPEPVLVGRREHALKALAEQHGLDPANISTDVDAVLADPTVEIYFDAQVTSAREEALQKAIAAGKHIYTEKPTATDFEGALELARLADAAGIKHGVVQDKLFLPGLLKLKRLIDGGFFGRILSIRGEFGYWVFEGDWQSAQRPSWNYRSEDGGGIVVDMFPHWEYVLHELFGRVKSVQALTATHIPQRWDEQDKPYDATADDAAYGVFELEAGPSPRSTPPGPSASTATNSSSSRSTAPRARPSRACATAVSSTAVRPPSRSGTPTSRPPTPSATSGRRSPTTPSSTTASRPSGSSSSSTSTPTRPTTGTCWPAPAASSSPNWA
jgi:predicted dehydrogenase